jgi:hypothetical protein
MKLELVAKVHYPLFYFFNYTGINVLMALYVVEALVGVDNNLTWPPVILASNVAKDAPVLISPYCTKNTVLPSWTKLISMT